jgi:hypothetical protein
VVKFQTFDQQIAERFTQDRMVPQLMTLFSAVVLLLATLGLYGVTAYTVARRTSEIGIRMALGANRGSVVGMIMRGATLQTADTGVHPDLLNSRFGYVSISRASHEATLFTDDMARLVPQLGADVSKTSALEIKLHPSHRELG